MAQRVSSGFTLVETLMVVAIIAVVAAIVFAALGPSREKARQTVCVSNLHQFQKAVAMYAQEWDGRDAQIGSTWDEIGLPPRSYEIGFLKEFGLYGSPVCRCPNYVASEIRLHISYVYPLASYSVSKHLQALLARKGGQAPLMYCTWHIGSPDPTRLPTWTQVPVPVLRASGQVEVRRTVPMALSTAQI